MSFYGPLLVSDPPQRALSFALDETQYEIRVGPPRKTRLLGP